MGMDSLSGGAWGLADEQLKMAWTLREVWLVERR
jgi:hypothetical protein